MIFNNYPSIHSVDNQDKVGRDLPVLQRVPGFTESPAFSMVVFKFPLIFVL